MGQSSLGVQESLERFDPHEEAGKLIDSEHRGRYWWAAQVVDGKDVFDAGCGLGYGAEILSAAGAASLIGLDSDEGAVEEARNRLPGLADSFVCADLRDLPVPEASFDVVVCFETIQHVQDSELVLGELHRVLRPGGLLLISSPSPDVYPPGNEHHVHEYRPTELLAVVEERFANVSGYRQHPWLASAIEPAPNGSDPSVPRRRQTRATAALDPGAETYSILAASDGDLPDLGDLVTLGRDFEVKWWAEQVAAAERRAGEERAESERRAREEIAAAQGQARERIAEVEESQRQVREQIEAAEREARERATAAEARAQGQIEAVERIARERAEEAAQEAERRLAAVEAELRRDLAVAAAREKAAKTRLRETSAALLEANQSLAKLPALQHRYEELEALRAHVEILEGSRSWRYMAPLRRIRHFLRWRRSV